MTHKHTRASPRTRQELLDAQRAKVDIHLKACEQRSTPEREIRYTRARIKLDKMESRAGG